MTPQVEKQIIQIKKILEDNPADANVYILLTAMIDLTTPVIEKLMLAAGPETLLVAGQINLINDIAQAIIKLLDIKKANLK